MAVGAWTQIIGAAKFMIHGWPKPEHKCCSYSLEVRCIYSYLYSYSKFSNHGASNSWSSLQLHNDNLNAGSPISLSVLSTKCYRQFGGLSYDRNFPFFPSRPLSRTISSSTPPRATMWFSTSNFSTSLPCQSTERSAIGYEPLLAASQDYELRPLKTPPYKREAISSLIFFAGIISGLVIARISGSNGIASTRNLKATSLVYRACIFCFPSITGYWHEHRSAPAHSALHYQVRWFNASFGTHLTECEGPPSEALDEKWHDLYRCRLSPLCEAIKANFISRTLDGITVVLRPKVQSRITRPSELLNFQIRHASRQGLNWVFSGSSRY